MFYGEIFQSTDEFIRAFEEYLWYYNNEKISLKLKGMSPAQDRTELIHKFNIFCLNFWAYFKHAGCFCFKNCFLYNNIKKKPLLKELFVYMGIGVYS